VIISIVNCKSKMNSPLKKEENKKHIWTISISRIQGQSSIEQL